MNIGCTEETNGQVAVSYGKVHAFCFIRNLAKGLVLKVPYFRTSFYQILVLKVP